MENLFYELLDAAKMSYRPEFYAGNGNNYGDLDSPRLEKMHAVALRVGGADVARAFVQTVEALTAKNDMSATSFIIAMRNLERNGWKFEQHTAPGEVAALAEVASDTLRDGPDALAALGTVMFGGFQRENKTHASVISGEFLRRHKAECAQAASNTKSYVDSYEARRSRFENDRSLP